MENRLTVTRGERGANFRGKSEGFAGKIIKDTWTIMGDVGRAGVERKGRKL